MDSLSTHDASQPASSRQATRGSGVNYAVCAVPPPAPYAFPPPRFGAAAVNGLFTFVASAPAAPAAAALTHHAPHPAPNATQRLPGTVLVQQGGGGGGGGSSGGGNGDGDGGGNLPLAATGLPNGGAGMHCLSPPSHLAATEEAQLAVSVQGTKRRRLTADERLERSRERNRIHARKTRLRRKQKMELLQGRRAKLVEEQQRLREAVKDHEAAPILLGLRKAQSGLYNNDAGVSRMTVCNVAEHNILMDAQQLQRMSVAAAHPTATCGSEPPPFSRSLSGDETEGDHSEESDDPSNSSCGESSSTSSSTGGRHPHHPYHQFPPCGSGSGGRSDPFVAISRQDRARFTPAELERLRRERNRMHAKRTRDRKKVLQEETESDIRRLEEENSRLRETISELSGTIGKAGRAVAALRRQGQGDQAAAADETGGRTLDGLVAAGSRGATVAAIAVTQAPTSTSEGPSVAHAGRKAPDPQGVAKAAPSARPGHGGNGLARTSPAGTAVAKAGLEGVAYLMFPSAASETSSAATSAESLTTSSSNSGSSNGSGSSLDSGSNDGQDDSSSGHGSNNDEVDSSGHASPPPPDGAAASSESSSVRNSASENEEDFADPRAAAASAPVGGEHGP